MAEGEWVPEDTRVEQARGLWAGGGTEGSVGVGWGGWGGDMECWLLCVGLVPGQGDDLAWGGGGGLK